MWAAAPLQRGSKHLCKAEVDERFHERNAFHLVEMDERYHEGHYSHPVEEDVGFHARDALHLVEVVQNGLPQSGRFHPYKVETYLYF